MKNIYLIDYENVGSDGLLCCDRLTSNDRVIVFFTKNAPKIDMTKISNLKNHMLDIIEVPAGKQSADMHIGSCLGYLIGKYQSKDCRIVIISRDTDFDNLISSWNEGKLKEKIDDKHYSDFFRRKTKVKVCRSKKIKSDLSALKPAQPIKCNRKVIELTEEQKAELYQTITDAVNEAGFDASVGNEAARISVELFPCEQFTAEIHNELQNKYKGEGFKIYHIIKPILLTFSQNPPIPKSSVSEEKIEIN